MTTPASKTLPMPWPGPHHPRANATPLGAAYARMARSPRWTHRHKRPATSRANSTLRAARSRLTRTSVGNRALRAEWPRPAQKAAIERGGMAAATAWRSGAYGSPASVIRQAPTPAHPLRERIRLAKGLRLTHATSLAEDTYDHDSAHADCIMPHYGPDGFVDCDGNPL